MVLWFQARLATPSRCCRLGQILHANLHAALRLIFHPVFPVSIASTVARIQVTRDVDTPAGASDREVTLSGSQQQLDAVQYEIRNLISVSPSWPSAVLAQRCYAVPALCLHGG